jgi:hypothetical protein
LSSYVKERVNQLPDPTFLPQAIGVPVAGCRNGFKLNPINFFVNNLEEAFAEPTVNIAAVIGFAIPHARVADAALEAKRAQQ